MSTAPNKETKSLSVLSYEAEVREGYLSTPLTRFFARFNGLPTEVKAGIHHGELKVKTATFYDTVFNESTTPILHFFPAETRRDVKVGITNLPYNRLDSSDLFFVDSVRLLYGQILEGSQAITEASKATAQAVLGVDFFKDEYPQNVVNGTFQVQVGGQDAVTNTLTSALHSENPKVRKALRLESLYIADGKPFVFSLNLAGANLKVSDVLRLEVSGILVTK